MATAGVERPRALMSLTSVLGAGALIPTAAVAEEAISRPFRLRLELVSPDGAIDPGRMLDSAICLKVQRPGARARHFHGIVREFAATGPAPREHWGYVAEV